MATATPATAAKKTRKASGPRPLFLLYSLVKDEAGNVTDFSIDSGSRNAANILQKLDESQGTDTPLKYKKVMVE
tara:strand:- start:357 stop:578 length:222 start_codon:yes stop_codon:yes gene_type:complete